MTASLPGVTLAFIASLFWTFTSVFFASAGRRIGSYYVNILRLSMAALLLCAIAAVYIACKGTAVVIGMPPKAFIWLSLSGVFGLAVGDAFYLKALTMLGPRRTTQLLTLAPIVSVVIAWVLMDERLSLSVLAGIAMIIAGIVYAVAHERALESVATAEPGKFSVNGFFIGAAGSLFQGIGAVMARQAFLAAPHLDPIIATTVRIVTSAVALVAVACCMRGMGEAFRRLHRRDAFVPLILGTVAGPVLGMVCYVSAFKFAATGIVSTLSSLSPLCILPVIAIRYRVKIPVPAIIGTAVAVVGVAIMAFQ